MIPLEDGISKKSYLNGSLGSWFKGEMKEFSVKEDSNAQYNLLYLSLSPLFSSSVQFGQKSGRIFWLSFCLFLYVFFSSRTDCLEAVEPLLTIWTNQLIAGV